MDRTPSDHVVKLQGEIERELAIVASAIDLVASGAASRVSLGSLPLAAELLPSAKRLALKAGVRIVADWTTDESHASLRVEAMNDG